jgi:ribosomal protein S18 acetylase RimI-like enzyme
VIELVPVRRDEIEQLAPMLAEYWRELDEFVAATHDDRELEAAKRLLYEAISRGDGVFWITDDNKEVGFVEYSVGQHWSRPDITVGHIAEIYVQPDYRRKGAGREAMGKILDEMASGDVAYVTLATSLRNETARRFWESLGFSEDRIEMRRTLREPA